MAEPVQDTPAAHPALGLHRQVLVIGAGTMGSGIAEVAAVAGHAVWLLDRNPQALEKGRDQLTRNLQRRLDKGRIDAAAHTAISAISARVRCIGGTDELGPAAAAIGLVIEAIVEDLEIKSQVLASLEPLLPDDAMVCSNTSSLSITALAARLRRPAQCAGMHFFNPAPAMPLVEIISGRATAPAVMQTLMATAQAWGKVPVACASTPGFIVNRVARPFYAETLRLLQEQAAAPATLDAMLRDGGGFRMGACELMDLIGHDVNFAVTSSVHQAFFGDPRYQPSLIQKDLVDAGWLGRKSGRGFYDYTPGAPTAEPVACTPPSQRPHSVTIDGSLTQAPCLEALLNTAPDLLVEWRPAPGGDTWIHVDGFALALTDGRTASERSVAAGKPVVLFDLCLDFQQSPLIALSAAVQATPAHVEAAIGLFHALGKKVCLIADVPGMAVARTVAMLVNEAAEAAHHGIATPADIDTAMCKGVNYPLGPLSWGGQLGWEWVAGVIRHLAQAYGEDRYRVSPWLQRQVHATQAWPGVTHQLTQELQA